jgi:hypothetical protein
METVARIALNNGGSRWLFANPYGRGFAFTRVWHDAAKEKSRNRAARLFCPSRLCS